MKSIKAIFVALLSCSISAMDSFRVRSDFRVKHHENMSDARSGVPNFSFTYSQQHSSIVGRYWNTIRQERPRSSISQLGSMPTEFEAQHYLAELIIHDHAYRNALYQNLARWSEHTFARGLEAYSGPLEAISFFNELLSLAPDNVRYQFLCDYEKIIFDGNAACVGITNGNRQELLKILCRLHRSFFTSEEDHQKILQRAAQTHPNLRDLYEYSKSHRIKPYNLLDNTVGEKYESSYIARYNHLSHLLKDRKFDEAETYFEHCFNEVRDHQNKGLRRTRELYASMIGVPKLNDHHVASLRQLLDNELRIERERQSLPSWLKELEPHIKKSWDVNPKAAINLEHCIQLALAKGDCADWYEKLSGILAQAILGNRDQIVLELSVGQELSELQKTYEKAFLATIMDYCDYLAQGKSEYRKILAELLDIWRFAAHPNSDIETALAQIFKDFEHKDIAPEFRQHPSFAAQEGLQQEATIETTFTARAEQLQLDTVSTGRETVEERNYVSAMQRAIIETRMLASTRGDTSVTHSDMQSIVTEVVQRFSSTLSRLDPYAIADSEGVIQAKLEKRINIGMKELQEAAHKLHTKEEVWNLFDRIVDGIDLEYKAIFPGMHNVAVEHFCHSLGLSTDINTWSTDDLMRAGRTLFQRNASNIKHTVTFMPQVVYSVLSTGYDWLSGKQGAESILNGPAQFYYVWTSLSPYQQKTLVTKFLVDQAIEAPSSFGIIKYGGTVARSIQQMMATGARAAAGRMTSSPLWVGLRSRLASIEHAKPGHIEFQELGARCNGVIKCPESIKNYSNGRVITTFSELDFEKCMEHMFSESHIKRGIDKLGLNRQDIVDKTIEVIVQQDRLGKLTEGTNTIALKLSGHDSIIKVHIINGAVMSINLFKGTTNRVVGNFINL